ncbi:MAG: metal-dependent transcriptional regulator [Lachnospiraceae bacterium]|nr:metal-dependent transcriptional regulator [Lachnospiraceae bacterium]
MEMHESAENYLESIIILREELPVVRSVDIANYLGFKKSSVSVAMKNLRENDMITVSPQGYITLTEKGEEVASTIYERHIFISENLQKLGVPRDIAIKDACRIEHVISPESFEALKKHLENMKIK